MNTLEGKKLSLGTAATCTEIGGNKSTINYQCQPETTQYNPNSQQFSSVRFDHTSSFSVSICEVVVYANPSGKSYFKRGWKHSSSFDILWSALSDCGEPEIPANGQVYLNNQNNYLEANFTCRDGYELKGEGVRMCTGRTWSGNQPTCKCEIHKTFYLGTFSTVFSVYFLAGIESTWSSTTP